MTKVRFTHWKLTAVCAVLALVTAWSVSASRATSSPAGAKASPEVNINSELHTLESFGDDLSKFDKKRGQLGKKNSVTDTEFTLFKRDHDALKQRFSQVPNAIRAIIEKLKAAGKWDTFDEDLLASSTDEKFKASVREFGGAKKLFEDGALQLGGSSAAAEILGSLDDVQKKVAGYVPDRSQQSEFRMVAASYNPGVPIFTRSAGCVLATIGYGAKMIAHPFTHVSAPMYSCKCHGACGDATT